MEKITVDKILPYGATPVDIAVPSAENDVWSHSVKMSFGNSFCVSMRAKSTTGTPDIDIYLEQTHLNPELTSEGNANSTGEGVIGDVYNGWVAPAGSSKIIDITDEAWHHFTISPLALPYLRLKFDPQGANPADCTVECYISKQESIT